MCQDVTSKTEKSWFGFCLLLAQKNKWHATSWMDGWMDSRICSYVLSLHNGHWKAFSTYFTFNFLNLLCRCGRGYILYTIIKKLSWFGWVGLQRWGGLWLMIYYGKQIYEHSDSITSLCFKTFWISISMKFRNLVNSLQVWKMLLVTLSSSLHFLSFTGITM